MKMLLGNITAAYVLTINDVDGAHVGQNKSERETPSVRHQAEYLLVLMFGTADMRLVLLHRVELDVADGAGVALQSGSCTHITGFKSVQ